MVIPQQPFFGPHHHDDRFGEAPKKVRSSLDPDTRRPKREEGDGVRCGGDGEGVRVTV